MTRAAPFLLLCLSAAHCGDSSPPTQNMNPPVGTTTQPICVKTEPLPIEPGQEATRCITGHLPTNQPLDVVQIDTRQTSTHHVIFYREKPEVKDQSTHDCPPLDILGGGLQIVREPLFIGETPEATLKMPPNVAYAFPAASPYTIEVHYFNPGTKTITASAEVCLTPAAAGQTPTPADMFFFASVTPLNKSYDGKSKGLPPGKTTTINPPGFQTLSGDIKVFGLTSHQHRTGTEFVISKTTSRDAPGQVLLRNIDWEHPELLRFPDDQLLTFDAKKGEGLRWTCAYNNTNDFYLTFGQSAYKNEMCILWGYYYPGAGFSLHFE